MERRMFETSVATARGRRALTLPASMAIHTLVLAAAITLPLLGGSDLPEVAASGLRVIFVEPQPLPAAPPPPPPPPDNVKKPEARAADTAPNTSDLFQPKEIPDVMPEDDPADPFGMLGGDPNGVPGGVAGGVPGGIVGGLLNLPGPATEVQAVRPGGRIREPRKLRDVTPTYPELAKRIGLQGDVVLECLIDARGRVAETGVVSGSPLLSPAAIEAARQWLYTPTLLNGVPVPIMLRVTVRFRLDRA